MQTNDQETKAKVTVEKIHLACHKLIEENPGLPLRQVVTNDRVLAKIGGSKTTIVPIVRKFKEDYEKESEKKRNFDPEIEKHLEIIIKLAGKEFSALIASLQESIVDKDRDYEEVVKGNEELKMILDQKEQDLRKFLEKDLEREAQILILKEQTIRKDQELQTWVEKSATFENELRNKNENLEKMILDLRKREKQQEKMEESLLEKDRQLLDMQKEHKILLERAASAESFLKAKGDIIEDFKKTLKEEREEIKKVRWEWQKQENEVYKWQGEVERLKSELKIKEEKLESAQKRLEQVIMLEKQKEKTNENKENKFQVEF